MLDINTASEGNLLFQAFSRDNVRLAVIILAVEDDLAWLKEFL